MARRHLEPLDAELLVRLERTADAHVTSSIVAAGQVGLGDGSAARSSCSPRAGGAPVGLLSGRIRGAITAEPMVGFRPSASFAVAAFPLHRSTTAEVMKVADGALYRAREVRRR